MLDAVFSLLVLTTRCTATQFCDNFRASRAPFLILSVTNRPSVPYHLHPLHLEISVCFGRVARRDQITGGVVDRRVIRRKLRWPDA